MNLIENMQNTRWRFGAWAVCAALVLGALTMPVYAAEPDKVTATLAPAVKVVIDDVSQTFYTASGTEVHPIVYNDTVYLPIRSVGELLGKTMTWDEATLTVTLSGKRTAAKASGTPDTSTKSKKISAQLRPDFTVVVDGTVRSFTDASGAKLSPMLYSGTIYLPLQSAGDLLGKTATWNSKTNTATLKTRSTGSSVTDADSFGSAPAASTPAATAVPAPGTQTISKEKAKSIALAHAGLTAKQVTFAHAYLEKDDRRWEYDIEFYTSDYTEYDYEIDAVSGVILSFDSDAEYYSRSATNTPSTTAGSYIGAAKAKELALARAGLAASAIRSYKSELDREDGVMVYEIEFESAGYDYDVRVNATTGTIVKYERERD